MTTRPTPDLNNLLVASACKLMLAKHDCACLVKGVQENPDQSICHIHLFILEGDTGWEAGPNQDRS